MPYISEADLIKAFGADEITALTDRDGDDANDVDVIEQTLDRVDALVNSHLASRYALPLAETPELIREASLHIARYILAGDHVTDRVRDDYKQALKWLVEIREGKLDIGLTVAGGEAQASGGGPRHGGGRATFNRDALDLYAGET